MIDVRNILDFKNFIDDLLLHSLTELYGRDILSIEHTRLMILQFACVDSMVSNESLRYSLDLHKAEIAEILKDMCNVGLLVSKGYGRGTTYHLPDKVASSEDERLQAQGIKVAGSEDERLQVQGIKVASPKRTRMSYSALAEKICSIAQDTWVTQEEITNITGRQKAYLRNKILPRMLADGLIEMLYPNIPTHPKQQYKTITGTDTTSSQ